MEIKTLELYGFPSAIIGMRNSYKSHYRMDSKMTQGKKVLILDNDLKLMKSLCKAGPEHRKWMRMIQVWADIKAPLYWWSEFDTYKVGTSANSESTMHTLKTDDVSINSFELDGIKDDAALQLMNITNQTLQLLQAKYKVAQTQEEKTLIVRTMKTILPTSWLQRRVVNLNYEVIHNMYQQRKNHRLPQWNTIFVKWAESLPYSFFITEKFIDKEEKSE